MTVRHGDNMEGCGGEDREALRELERGLTGRAGEDKLAVVAWLAGGTLGKGRAARILVGVQKRLHDERRTETWLELCDAMVRALSTSDRTPDPELEVVCRLGRAQALADLGRDVEALAACEDFLARFDPVISYEDAVARGMQLATDLAGRLGGVSAQFALSKRLHERWGAEPPPSWVAAAMLNAHGRFLTESGDPAAGAEVWRSVLSRYNRLPGLEIQREVALAARALADYHWSLVDAGGTSDAFAELENVVKKMPGSARGDALEDVRSLRVMALLKAGETAQVAQVALELARGMDQTAVSHEERNPWVGALRLAVKRLVDDEYYDAVLAVTDAILPALVHSEWRSNRELAALLLMNKASALGAMNRADDGEKVFDILVGGLTDEVAAVAECLVDEGGSSATQAASMHAAGLYAKARVGESRGNDISRTLREIANLDTPESWGVYQLAKARWPGSFADEQDSHRAD